MATSGGTASAEPGAPGGSAFAVGVSGTAGVTADAARAAARALVEELAAAPVNDRRCDPRPVEQRPDLAVLVRVSVAGKIREAYVNPAGCPDGDGMSGGVDDGTTVRVLTRPACQKLLAPPLALWSAGGDVGRNCLG